MAEEVARIYPELVTYGADGKVQTVNDLTLASMLFNELQKQARLAERQAGQLHQQRRQIDSLSGTNGQR